MAAGDQELPEGDRCTTAMDAVHGVGLDECHTTEAKLEYIGRIIGVSPPDDAQATLSAGLDEAVCGDFTAVREWVVARAVDEIETEGTAFSDALEAAWDEATSACANAGTAL